ncbi:MAG TPA: hypothetical protein VFD60_09235 [Nitrososphaeraceae archaeon]|nr:hypothetical protein [Nitrososphaeraceae archaeon]
MTTILFVITIAFSLVSSASNMSIALHATSSASSNLNNLNGDPTHQSHKPCSNGSAPDINGKCQTTVCSNGSAPDINGNCTSSTPHRQSSSLENNTSVPSPPSPLLPSPTTRTCPDGSDPDANGYCTPYPLPPAP